MRTSVRPTAKAAQLPLHVAAARALRRAARTARETSRRTGTPLVTWHDGKIVRARA